MAWNINFKTYRNREIEEEGFETAFSEENVSAVLKNIDEYVATDNIDRIELTINKIEGITWLN